MKTGQIPFIERSKIMLDYEEAKRVLTPLYVRDLNPELKAQYAEDIDKEQDGDLVIGYYIPAEQYWYD